MEIKPSKTALGCSYGVVKEEEEQEEEKATLVALSSYGMPSSVNN